MLSLPHGEAQKKIELYSQLAPRLIDLSADFNLRMAEEQAQQLAPAAGGGQATDGGTAQAQASPAPGQPVRVGEGIPGQYITLWSVTPEVTPRQQYTSPELAGKLLEARTSNLYPGQVAVNPEIQSPVANDPGAAQRGMLHFVAFNCIGCHADLGSHIRVPRAQLASQLEPMLARRVVRHLTPPDDVRLGRVKVAAVGIDAERPLRLSKPLPGGQSERVAQHVADDGDRRPGPRRERQFRRTAKRSKGSRLRRPVQIAEGPGELVKVMLGVVVVAADQSFCASAMRRSISAIACMM